MTDDALGRRIDALRRSSIFAGLPEGALERLARVMKEFAAPAGRVLIEPRQKGAGMFVIEDGSVVVQAPGIGLVDLGPGDVVGELALLTPDGTRTARVQAKSDVRCLTIARADLEAVLEEEPQIAVALLDVVAERLPEGPGRSG